MWESHSTGRDEGVVGHGVIMTENMRRCVCVAIIKGMVEGVQGRGEGVGGRVPDDGTQEVGARPEVC